MVSVPFGSSEPAIQRLRAVTGLAGVRNQVQRPPSAIALSGCSILPEAISMWVPDDVAIFIARHVKSNVRELEGLLNRVMAFSSLTGKPLSIELAKETLKDILAQEGRQNAPAEVVKHVARYYGLKVQEIKSKTNSKQIVFPRQVAMYLLKQVTDLSFPENRGTPIAASLRFADPEGAEVTAEFDWRQEGPQTWDIKVETGTGRLKLSRGGAELAIDGRTVEQAPDREYAGIYRRFAELIRTGRSDVDLSPMIHVADAFTLGRRIAVEPFEF